MAMKKKLISIEVHLLGKTAATLNSADTKADRTASRALEKFDEYETMKVAEDGKYNIVPFHAVDHIIVKKSEVETEARPNPYGCEPDGTVGGSRVGC